VRVDLRVISSTTAIWRRDRGGRFRRNFITGSTWCPSRCRAGGAARGHPELARHFIELFNSEQGLPLRDLGEEAVALLQTMSLARQRAPAAAT
jgi:two-component system nitrogen regulation response regulator NtrX